MKTCGLLTRKCSSYLKPPQHSMHTATALADARGFRGSGMYTGHSRCGMALLTYIWGLNLGRTERLKMRTTQRPFRSTCPEPGLGQSTAVPTCGLGILTVWQCQNSHFLDWGSEPQESCSRSCRPLMTKSWKSHGLTFPWCVGQSNHKPTLVQGMEAKSLWPRL